jgi:Fur family ferric uptake transcriptional regulator
MVPGVPATDEIEQLLRGTDLRVTRPRLAVLAAVHGNPHADTSSIIEAVRDEIGEVSHQAVYDGLHVLSGAGLLRQIQPPGSVALYEPQTGDNHHHMVCRSCGEVVDVDCAVGSAPCLEPSDDLGYTIDEAEVVYRGLCPDCSNKTQEKQDKPPRKESDV